MHLSAQAQSRNRLWFWALVLETSCHWEILMQENNAVMLHFYPLASLKLKSVCNTFLEVSPAPASASTAINCALDQW